MRRRSTADLELLRHPDPLVLGGPRLAKERVLACIANDQVAPVAIAPLVAQPRLEAVVGRVGEGGEVLGVVSAVVDAVRAIDLELAQVGIGGHEAYRLDW